MTPELEQEHRQLAIHMLETFGDKMFDMLLSSLGGKKRLIDVACDGIWLGMRGEVLKFPEDLLRQLKPLKGSDRIKVFLLTIAPQYLMDVPIENVENTLHELEPFLDRLQTLRKAGENNGDSEL